MKTMVYTGNFPNQTILRKINDITYNKIKMI
jgi:hypothetical protein